MIKTSESIDCLATALAKAQGSMPAAKKNGKVDYQTKRGKLQFSYSTLDDLKECSKKTLSENELSIIQPVSREGTTVTVSTRLMHSSGQWIQSSLSLIASDLSPQSIGSVTTYAKRYSYAAMLSIPDSDDDDGQAGAGIGAVSVQSSQAPGREKPVEKHSLRMTDRYNNEDDDHKIFLNTVLCRLGITQRDEKLKMSDLMMVSGVKLNEMETKIKEILNH